MKLSYRYFKTFLLRNVYCNRAMNNIIKRTGLNPTVVQIHVDSALYFLVCDTDSICLLSASRIRNTLFLFEISSFICWCISKQKQKREAVLMNFSMQTEREFQMRSNQMLNIKTEAWPMPNSLQLMLTKKKGECWKIILVRIESANYLNGNQGNWHSK